MIDSKERVLGWSNRTSGENPFPKKQKREQGSRSPNRVFSKVYCTKGIIKVKKNLSGKYFQRPGNAIRGMLWHAKFSISTAGSECEAEEHRPFASLRVD